MKSLVIQCYCGLNRISVWALNSQVILQRIVNGQLARSDPLASEPCRVPI